MVSSSSPNLSENTVFSPVKLLIGPPIEMDGGSPVQPVTTPVEPDNAPTEPNKRRRTENDKERSSYRTGNPTGALVAASPSKSFS